MKTDITFGDCLSALLKVFKINSSKLAKGINVDSSLVYKWIRNERVPAYSSPYVELIVSFLIKNISNSYQRNAIADTLQNYGNNISNTDDGSLKDVIHTMLLETQGYTIELYLKEKKLQKNKDSVSSIKKLLASIDTPPITKYNKKNQVMKQNTQIQEYNHSPQKSVFLNENDNESDNIEIIKGCKEVLYSALDLMNRAPEIPARDDDTILITLNSNMSLLTEYNEFSLQWKNTLYKVLSNGWKVIFLVRLNNNVKRSIKIIDNMLLALAAGNFNVFYYKRSADAFNGNELIIVPGTGALYCLSSHNKNQVDSGFLFHSRSSINVLSAHFFQLFASAKPLLKSYPSQNSPEFQQAFAEIEESLGDRYVFKGGLSTITMPLNIYEKHLRLSCKSDREISFRMLLHKRRLDAFSTQVKYYSFKDIWFKESIERLITERKYSFDEYYILEDNIPQSEDIISHLENVIDMLQKYKNYEVAIVSEKNFEHIPEIYWMVKDECNVLIETINKKENRTDACSFFSSEINLSISEKEIINAFRDYFFTIWNSLSSESKDKNNTINWLKSIVATSG